MRVHAGLASFAPDESTPLPNWFQDKPRDGDGMSTDWERHRTPEQTRSDDGRRDARNFAVVEITVADVAAVPDQCVEHDPLPENRAHTLVHGPKKAGDPKNRVLFARIARARIRLSDPSS